RREDGQTAPATSPAIWAVAAQIERENIEPCRIGVGQVPSAPGRRTIRIDGKNSTGTELARRLTIMWLTPAQDRLFTGPAGERRRFLDRFCLVHAPEHGKASLRYEKSRSERNRLLSEGSDDRLWFDALEADMASCGAHIAQARAITVAALKAEINARPLGAFPKAALILNGEAEALFESGAEFLEVEDFIKTNLRIDRAVDRRAGRTLRGVHKADLIASHIGKSMPASDCSTGEQKALLIGLTLAHARAQAERSPILLLDEIAAHLDSERRAALIEELLDLGTQVFMTGTDASLFEAFKGRAQSFHVEGGQVNLA
ncbi:MAG: AAA family ATPase, partial [Robiginitomaculum sp.]